jgi:lipopolysaccharide biosynthesis regulator YciM
MDGVFEALGGEPALWAALFVAAMAGALVGGFVGARVWRRRRRDRSAMPDGVAGLPGVNYILTNDTDAAIEELTRAVAASRGSIEMSLALGALFRSKGEIERAIRLHKSLLDRADIDEVTRTQVTFELGLDYRKAGLLERAITTFGEVLSLDADAAHAYRELQRLYEESGDWGRAYDMQRQVARRTGERADSVLSHHLVEMGQSHEQRGDLEEAARAYRKALSIDEASVHASLALGRLLVRSGDAREAIAHYERAMARSPAISTVIYPRLEEAYRQIGEEARYERLLRERVVQDEADIFARFALAQWLRRRGRLAEAIDELRRAIAERPDFIEARKELGDVLRSSGTPDDLRRAYEELLDAVVRPMRSYQCRQCGYEAADLEWKCPQCQRWDTIAHKRFRRERRRRLRVA